MSSEESTKRPPKANKACLPCRTRKVKCDAPMIGLPCSSCTSRECATDCVLPTRKGRTRKRRVSRITGTVQAGDILVTSSISQVDDLSHLHQPDPTSPLTVSNQSCTSESLDCESSHHAEPDLLYLNILKDAVTETPEDRHDHTTSSAPLHTSPQDRLVPRGCMWTRLPQLDDIDNAYLERRGVFDLPSPGHLDTLVRTYFDHVHPFFPILNRAEFIREYQSGNCSLFLLRAILTPTSVHAPMNVLSACGFPSRSVAQESFFSKAKLLHDFYTQDDPLMMLQGSIILCMVILDHPTDRDFGYWFHNAIRLATKLDIHNTCIRENKPLKTLKMYRKIWWALYALDIFHVFINTRHTRLLGNTSTLKPRTEDDNEEEDTSAALSGLLPPVTPQQKAIPVIYCELFLICQSIHNVENKPQQDPRQMMQPLDTWRKSLVVRMHVGSKPETDIYYLNMQAMSYRFECILCRLIRRNLKQSQHEDWSGWAKQRLQNAILELDTISMRVLASGTLRSFPVSFITTITALLALHIETALDQTETELVRSLARISINQTMLVLAQGKDIPALKRALPVFEDILAKQKLYLVPTSTPWEVPAQSQHQDGSVVGVYSLPHSQGSAAPSQLQNYESNILLYGDFLGFDFLDDWQTGQLDFH